MSDAARDRVEDDEAPDRRIREALRVQARRFQRMEAALQKLMATQHEIANALQGMSLHLQFQHVDAPAAESARTIESLLRQATDRLERCRSLLHHATRPSGLRVRWAPVLEAASRQFGFALEVDRGTPEEVVIEGGADGLERVVVGLVKHAGDARLQVTATRDPSGDDLLLLFVDDGSGPASPDERMRLPSTATDGLVLFGVDCLVRGSGGSLHIGAGKRGGTTVSVRLGSGPEAFDAAASGDT